MSKYWSQVVKNLEPYVPGEQPKIETFLELVEDGLVASDSFITKLTVSGVQLLREITGQQELVLKGRKSKENKFYEFWNAYPISDAHGKWKRTRSLKNHKEKCEELYSKYIKNGVKHDDIMKALKWQVAECKKNSQTSNRLTFMKNSQAWLNQREFEIILEDMKSTDNDEQDWTETII